MRWINLGVTGLEGCAEEADHWGCASGAYTLFLVSGLSVSRPSGPEPSHRHARPP